MCLVHAGCTPRLREARDSEGIDKGASGVIWIDCCGFSLHADTAVHAFDREGLRKLCGWPVCGSLTVAL